MSNIPWVHINEHAKDALNYIDGRRNGIIKSLLTPWTTLNNELLNGLEWRSVVMLCGNSGAGKTAISDQITDESFKLNPTQDYAVLKLQFEMLGRSAVMRNISGGVGKDLKTLSSAFSPISDEDYEEIKSYVTDFTTNNDIYIIDVPLNVVLIEKAIADFAAFIKKPFIIQLDHTMLVERSVEADEWGVIRNLGKLLIKTKKLYDIIWLVLNQFNSEFEKDDRQKPNQLSAYPMKKDIYGGGLGYAASDCVMALNKPSMYLPLGSYYGPKANQLVVTDKLLVIHVLKNRVGESNGLLIFDAAFEQMKIIEAKIRRI